jgi:Rrf2 family nitric oxide-sensitive transcriptional repressor
MRLTRFTDNALRTLGYLALEPDAQATVGLVARRMGMSEDHLLKVVRRLSQLGLVQTIRGRHGGLRLTRPAHEIVVGAVVRHTEDNLALVPCFDSGEVTCPIASICGLAPALDEALKAFLSTLDRYTIADMIVRRHALLQLTGKRDSPIHDAAVIRMA